MDTEEIVRSPNDPISRPSSSMSSTPSIKRKLPTKSQRNSEQKKEELLDLACKTLGRVTQPIDHKPAEDQFDAFGKKIGYDLRELDRRQRIYAEKLIADVIYYGKLGSLNELCSINVHPRHAQPIQSTYVPPLQTQNTITAAQHTQPVHTNFMTALQSQHNVDPELTELLIFNTQ